MKHLKPLQLTRLTLIPLLACLLLRGEAFATVINSNWTDGSGDGLWNTGMNWSPSGAPNNGANTYNVTMNLDGHPSGAVLNSAVTIGSLSLSGPDAALATNANLTVSGASTVTGELDVNSGTCFLGSLSNFSGTTLTGGVFSVSNATLGFTGANIVTNAANIVLVGSSSKIVNQNNVNALSNLAVIDPAGDFAVTDRTFSTSSIAFSNHGIIESIANSLSTKLTITGTLSNLSGTTLTGGEYDVDNYSGNLMTSAAIQLPGASISTNAATIVLYGANTQILNSSGVNVLPGLTTNTASGSLSLYERNLTFSGSLSNAGYIGLETYSFANTLTVAGTLTNTGTCKLYASGASNSIVVNTSLANFSGTTLTNGEFDLAAETGLTSTLKFPGANVVTNAAAISLRGQGAQIVNSNNVNGLANLAVNAATGEFLITDRNLTTIGNFTNNGRLGVSGWSVSSTFAVGGTLTNFTGTTLTDGEYDLLALAGQTATLKFPGANIVTNAANISLSGTGAGIFNSTNNSDGLANLSTNSASGVLSILNGKTFASSGTINNAGSLTIGEGGKLTIPSTNVYSQSGGVTTLAGGTLEAGTVSFQGGRIQGSGTIKGNVVTSGSNFSVSIRGYSPGPGAGQYDQANVTGTAVLGGSLNVTLASGMAGTLLASNTFTILTTTGSLGGSFTNAANGSRITTSDKAGSFLVTVTAHAIVLSDFYPSVGLNAWKTTPGLFSPAELADLNFKSADPDGDGLTNMMEYGFNRQPHVPDAAGVGQAGIFTIGGNQYMGITFTRSKGASDIIYQVEVSGDLATWESGSQFTAFQNRIDQGATELITWSDNTPLTGATKRFIRLKLLGP